MNIKLDSLRTHLEAMSLSLSHQYNWTHITYITESFRLKRRRPARKVTLEERFYIWDHNLSADDPLLNVYFIFCADQVLGNASGYPRVASLWTHQLSNQGAPRSGGARGSKNTCRHRIQVNSSLNSNRVKRALKGYQWTRISTIQRVLRSNCGRQVYIFE